MHGSEALGERLAGELRAAGKNPYVVPVGGSNALGCWGYMMALEELAQQTAGDPFTHIVMVRTLNAPCRLIALTVDPAAAAQRQTIFQRWIRLSQPADESSSRPSARDTTLK